MPTLATQHAFGQHKAAQPKGCKMCFPVVAAPIPGEPEYNPQKVTTNAAHAKPKRVRIVKSSDPTFPIEPALVGEVIVPFVSPLEAGTRIHAILEGMYAGQKYDTREAWMLAAVEAMRSWFVEVGAEVGTVRISIGWAGGRSAKGKGIRGQCWASHTVADGIPAIFVTPDQSDPIIILGIVLHEMNHAADNCLSGHRGTFAKTAKALGFVAPWTSSEGKTPELVERLTALLADLGTFPHGAINDKAHGLTGLSPARPPIQTTRMLKIVCEADGYTVRTTQKWIDLGLPACGICGEGMQTA